MQYSTCLILGLSILSNSLSFASELLQPKNISECKFTELDSALQKNIHVFLSTKDLIRLKGTNKACSLYINNIFQNEEYRNKCPEYIWLKGLATNKNDYLPLLIESTLKNRVEKLKNKLIEDFENFKGKYRITDDNMHYLAAFTSTLTDLQMGHNVAWKVSLENFPASEDGINIFNIEDDLEKASSAAWSAAMMQQKVATISLPPLKEAYFASSNAGEQWVDSFKNMLNKEIKNFHKSQLHRIDAYKLLQLPTLSWLVENGTEKREATYKAAIDKLNSLENIEKRLELTNMAKDRIAAYTWKVFENNKFIELMKCLFAKE